MEQMELRIGEQLQVLTEKLSSFAGLKEHLEELDQRVSQRLDQVQTKMDLSLVSLGQVQQDQAQVGLALKGVTAAPSTAPIGHPPGPAKLGGHGILGMPPGSTLHPPGATLQPGARLETAQAAPTSSSATRTNARQVTDEIANLETENQGGERYDRGQGNHRGLPRMDFPKFDGTDARIWIDTCNSYFLMYQIPEGFKVAAATMNLLGNAAHWYQAYKLDNAWHNWEQFQQAVMSEFELNVYRDKMRELLQLKQTGTVEEYTRQFNQLVYNIRLYDVSVGGMMLVTQFILGLKEELQGPVEAQLPSSVSMASTYATIHEAVFERQKKSGKAVATRPQSYGTYRKDNRPNNINNSGDMWKAQQLKEYRRANNLCFKCGDKYVPGHQCAQPVAQLKAIQGGEGATIISDAMLTAITELEQGYVSDSMFMSMNALAGTVKGNSLQLSKACQSKSQTAQPCTAQLRFQQLLGGAKARPSHIISGYYLLEAMMEFWVGSRAYKLELPEHSQIHPVFHVSQLKEHVPDHTPVYSDLPSTLELDLLDVQPEEILDRRLVKRGNTALLQLQIKWTSLPASMATWENESVLKARYPEAPVWGHPGSQAAGNVRYAMTGEKLGRPPDEVFTEDEKQELLSDKDASSSG
ncbi:hypothetical protein QYE76_067564 [Lolium multiflorum]|uniref:Chromo domain-containing protein n=1 Tax=Lolium multiflorum TaxID=4521 RepID=A0AAD8WD37_LOLMU|nr:hypothetical protein QYE76_067564 [Lolium multiflorum]